MNAMLTAAVAAFIACLFGVPLLLALARLADPLASEAGARPGAAGTAEARAIG